MSTSALESEDLENVPLVRMEDVQPSRTYEFISRRRSDEDVLETCVIEDIEYDNECIVNDDEDSNIGSMVSIKSEDMCDNDSDAEMIVPEPLEAAVVEKVKLETKPPSSWPTLEILPGGVIKKPQKREQPTDDSSSSFEDEPQKHELSNVCPSSFGDDKADIDEMMYACAKCSQRFRFLFCLVKHVKWHENEAKKLNAHKPKPAEPKTYVCMHSNKKKKMMICMRTHKNKSPKTLKS